MSPACLVTDLCRHGPRTVGSLAHESARHQLMGELLTVPGGFVRRESFPVQVDEDLSANVVAGESAMPAVRFAGSANVDGTLEGPARWCDDGSPHALRKAEQAIAIVRISLVRHRIRQMEAARAAGALAVVAVSAHLDEAEQGLGARPGDPMPIPGLCVPGRNAATLRGAPRLRLTWTVRRRVHQAENLILDLPGRGRPVLLCAHYDAWGGGAADNAAGVAVAIAVMRRMARESRRPALRLLLSDAEEIGLLGSAHHAEGAATGLRGCINLDQPVPGRDRLLRSAFLGQRLWRSAAPLACLRHGFIPLSLDWIYQVLGAIFPSDVHHFHRQGVPSASTFCAGPRHREGDRPSGLEAAGIARAVALACDLVRSLPP